MYIVEVYFQITKVVQLYWYEYLERALAMANSFFGDRIVVRKQGKFGAFELITVVKNKVK